MIVGKIFFVERRVFSNGLIRYDFKEEVRREKLTMERVVGAISLAMFLRTVVGIGSRLQC